MTARRRSLFGALLLVAIGAAGWLGWQRRPWSPAVPPLRPSPTPAAPVAAAPGPLEARLIVDDPAEVAALEADGLALGPTAFGIDARTTAELALDAGYRSIVETIERDIEALARTDPKAGVGMRHHHRLFDVGWLRSEKTWFELVAVVNRLDRRPFHPERCGETRLVYRLAYRVRRGEREVGSRLPMTMNVVFWQPAADSPEACGDAAAGWRVGDDAAGLGGAALAPSRLARSELKSIEVNVQRVRWPSTIRPDLGGHADYLLRVFRPALGDPADGPRFEPAPLENTPDVERIAADPALARDLRAWVAAPATLRAVEQGTARLPERFLAREALSVAPHGLARLANRPFARLVDAADLGDVDLTPAPSIASSVELVRRLDALSCTGCHQSRSLAGFHLLGEDARTRAAGNAVATGRSPHLADELERRARYLAAVLAGDAPDERRAPAERPAHGSAYGATCGVDPDGALGAWDCPEGLTCVAGSEAGAGSCLPDPPRVGSSCASGVLVSADAHERDRIARTDPFLVPTGLVCEVPTVGFPSGMLAGRCDGALPDDATCGAIALLGPFNECIARGEAFPECLSLARPAALRRCDARTPCRPDYLCARTATGEGACVPPYFLFQMRVDGHPL